MTINERLKVIRKTNGLTLAKFAAKIAVSTSYYAAIESGTRKANERIIKLVSTEFNVNKHWLITGNGSIMIEGLEENLAKAMSIFRVLPPRLQDLCFSTIGSTAHIMGGL